MSIVAGVLTLLAAASCVYWIVATFWMNRFFGRKPTEPDVDALPPVSILKAVSGVDFEAMENFESHLLQDYPELEVIFGVASAEDPVVELIGRLQEIHGHDRVRLIVHDPKTPNPKAGILDALAREARHDVLVAIDSDIRVPPDFLRRAAAPLADHRVGMVTFPYRGGAIGSFAARMEALGMVTSFLPGVIAARRLFGMRFALGAAIAVRRDVLATIGDFGAVGEYLADDYQLGHRVARAGFRIELSRLFVTSVLGPTRLGDLWSRELRWARAIRVSRTVEYPGILLTLTAPLALIAAAAWLVDAPGEWLGITSTLLVAFAIRFAAAARALHLSGASELDRWLLALPIREIFGMAVWTGGLAGRRVRWRGREFAVERNGRLTASPGHRHSMRIFDWTIRHAILVVDRILRRRYHIHEFSNDPRCIFRLGPLESEEALPESERAADIGAEQAIQFHLWNEHVPSRTSGDSLSWGREFSRRFLLTLRLLAKYVSDQPGLHTAEIFVGETSLSTSHTLAELQAMASRWGFRFERVETRHSGWSRFTTFWEHVYVVLLTRTFNAGGSAPGASRLQRLRIWITREELLRRYLARERRPPVSLHGDIPNDRVNPHATERLTT
ncbi:MAG: bacteriohopanetetrol glucosamine biosynthesis glycosyltransferase HpnI [Thermoanaerobaculia bacterium]